MDKGTRQRPLITKEEEIGLYLEDDRTQPNTGEKNKMREELKNRYH